MLKLTYAACAIALLELPHSARAIVHEPVPQTDQGEQIPNKTIKLNKDEDTPPAEQKKKKVREVKPREPDRTPVQTARKPPPQDQTDKGMSPEASRAIGTMIGIGVGFGLGRMGGGERGMGGGDRGMGGGDRGMVGGRGRE